MSSGRRLTRATFFLLLVVTLYSAVRLFPMHSRDNIVSVADSLLEPRGLKVGNFKPLQSLWAGYGHIVELQAVPLDAKSSKVEAESLILKLVTPPTNAKNVKDEGHLRKIISYQVEQYFYKHLAPSMPKAIAVSDCLASINTESKSGSTIAMILTDLKQTFPVAGEKRGALNETQVHSALDWLAHFHGHWWNHTDQLRKDNPRLPPLQEAELQKHAERQTSGIWLNGGYTYLATRRKEYQSLIDDSDLEWSRLAQTHGSSGQSIAELVAGLLAPSTNERTSSAINDYETMIHGDVKSENLFTSSAGDAVAFYDFQYVGIGIGVCDLAKLFTCSVPLTMLSDGSISARSKGRSGMGTGERSLLKRYQRIIQDTSGKTYPWQTLEMHWNTALVDWLRFQASWGFWGNTEWLEARVRYILDDAEWNRWLLHEVHDKR